MSDLAYVKERLSQFTTCNRKPQQCKYLEYWVPVELSTAQLEQNCSTLVSHSLLLQSAAKTDRVGALSGIVKAQRKCCDHPYLVDDALQHSLTENLSAAENLDVGIQTSGKLSLLDRILQEIRDRKQRAVVLFQVPGRDGKCCIGDILDDFLRQRFGENSYERLDGGVCASKKTACLNMFNIKEKGRFVFLAETRACSSSVRLTSVDAVIIFSSDWNPTCDLRALNKIRIESSAWPIKVFRLYSVFTVEEKALIFAKQESALDSNIQNFSSSVSRSLISWGASFAFSKLDEFHGNEKPAIGPVSLYKTPILDEVIKELLTVLPLDDAEKCTSRFSMISKCENTGSGYSKDVILLGERETVCSTEEQPSHVLWSMLLSGRNPKWKFVSRRCPWARRKPYSDSLAEKNLSGEENDALSKRPKKMVKIVVPKRQEFSKSLLEGSGHLKERDLSAQPRPTSPSPLSLPSPGSVSDTQVETALVEPGEKTLVCHLQDDAHRSMKHDLERLCGVLQLSPDVGEMAQILLAFILQNHQITLEPTIMQALLLSLCWRAAYVSKHKVDHSASLLVARRKLNFQCTEEEAESVYVKVHELRKTSMILDDFRRKTGREPECPEEDSRSLGRDVKTEDLEEGEISQREYAFTAPLVHTLTSDVQSTSSKEYLLRLRRIKLFERMCSMRADKLCRKHELEIEQLNCLWESQGTKLKKALEVELDLLNSIGFPCEVLKERSDIAEQKFQSRLWKFETHMKNQLKRLIALQAEAKNKEKNLTEFWLAEVNAGKNPELFNDIPLEDTCFSVEEFETLEHPASLPGMSGIDVSSFQPVLAGLPAPPVYMSPVPVSQLPTGHMETSDIVEHDLVNTHDENVSPPCGSVTENNEDRRALPICRSHQDNDVPTQDLDLSPGGSDVAPHHPSPLQVSDNAARGPREQQPLLNPTNIRSNKFLSGVGSSFSVPVAVESQAVDLKPLHPANTGQASVGPQSAALPSVSAPLSSATTQAPVEYSPVPGTSPDPLMRELLKIQRQAEQDAKLYELERKRLLSDLEQELDAVRKKHKPLIDELDKNRAEQRKLLSMNFGRVQLHWALAQDCSPFIESMQGTGQPSTRQLAQLTSLARHGQRHGGHAAGRLCQHQQGSVAPNPPAVTLTHNFIPPRVPPGYLLGNAPAPVLPPSLEAPLPHPLYKGWPPTSA